MVHFRCCIAVAISRPSFVANSSVSVRASTGQSAVVQNAAQLSPPDPPQDPSSASSQLPVAVLFHHIDALVRSNKVVESRAQTDKPARGM